MPDYEQSKARKKAVIFDIDGTLADISHRLHFIKNYKSGESDPKEVDWDAFNEACSDDRPKDDIINLFKDLKSCGYYMIVCTGRRGTKEVMWRTKNWLRANKIDWDTIYFRAVENYDQDAKVKESMLMKIRQDYDVFLAVDDRQRVVDMWRKNGVTCLQCQKGDY